MSAKSLSTTTSSSSTTVSAVMSPEMRHLASALQESFSLFQVLLHLVPTREAECQLRFVWAMLDYRATAKGPDSRTKAKFISKYFLKPQSEFQVHVPAQFRLLDLFSSKFTRAYKFALAELCALPEVMSCLDFTPQQKEWDGRSVNTSSLVSMASMDDYCGISPEHKSSKQKFTIEINIEAERLETVLKNKDTRRELGRELRACDASPAVLLHTQFLPAVDHFLTLKDKDEQRDMGMKIIEVFFQKNYTKSAVCVSAATERSVLQGKLENLAVARAEVLNHLCSQPSVIVALSNL